MQKFKLLIGYDGTHFCGWQKQKGVLSIQQLVEQALSTYLRHPISCIGASRTDAGVHAKGQVAHFQTTASVFPNALRYSLNALLPSTIRVFDIEPVSIDFHARYSALSKIYHYHLHLDPISDPFTRLYRYQPFAPIDLSLLTQAIPHFVGMRDFYSFANEGTKNCASQDSIRTLSRIDVVEQKGGIRLEFEGDGFLYKMVRNIVGTLLAVAQKKLSPDEIPALFTRRDRKGVGMTAPPQGLCLMQVQY